jgi:sterol desaturase/sphingolipid hydroxylase (fatty acid hydroxylase superfamily)
MLIHKIISFISQLGLPLIIANLIIFAIFEFLRPAHKNQPWRAYFLNIKITCLYLFFSNFWGGISGYCVAKAGAYFGLGLIDLRFAAGKNIILQLLAAFFVVCITDFFYYWFHRLQHTIPALWAQHKLHHLEENLNASTANRHHWLEELFRIPFLTLPIVILFKLDPIPAGIIGLLFSSWGFFIHANLRLELGQFARFFGGPQGHRIHHSCLEEHYDKNFAAFFPLWDIVFNTFHYPKRAEFPLTGIQGEKLTTLSQAAILPFRIWIKSIIGSVFPLGERS